MKKKVLVVDDSRYMRTVVRAALEEEGFDVVGEASNGEEAIDMAFSLKPDLITLDNILPDMSGIDILRVYKEDGLASRVIMISAVGQDSVIAEAISLGAESYIVKPFTKEKLIDKLVVRA